ncbi:long-chain-fatty-acid--CoA ligase [Flexivirga sp. ID2601S]|uniref:Long-chain-fatty-acid--CoA ligase n=1 Tax=Flexivirga aerilata TaxID=1656889 RepID=A0A849ADG2_9MICO|nr:long-chain-fatty-acid--CoA ligase [Flexivirga aerilata]NNG37793.1 long-chain-fatty-acid--CoA ligase [Flexivirga aerilata]
MTVVPDVPPLDAATRARRRTTWPNLVARHAFQQPEKPAFRWQGDTITWRQFQERASRFADALYAEGVRKGDRVALLTFNRPEFLDAVVGAQQLGAIAVPFNFRLTPPELAVLLGDAEPAVVVVDAALLPSLQAALADADIAPRVVVTAASDAPAAGVTWEDFVGADHPEHPVVDVAEDDPALIMFTSGTTGRPKGAVLSHLNLHGNGVTCLRAWQSNDDDITLLGTPLFHIGGLGVFSGAVLAGATVVLQPTAAFDAGETLDLMRDEHVTGTFLVPAQWQAMVAEQSRSPRDLQLRVLSWGAAPATEQLLRGMTQAFPGGANVAVFGQTEMSPVTCMLGERDAIRKLGSVGKPISTLATRVVDPLGQDVAPGEVGEILYRGPTQMLGYWRQPEATSAAFEGGWFHSGDLVRVDDEGFVYVIDRVKDMVITGGENVYCVEVENALADHPDIAEVTVVGRPHDKWGETVVAVAALRPGASLTIEQLRDFADGRLARYKQPTELHLLDALPRNASGKVVKATLRQQVAADEGTVQQ